MGCCINDLSDKEVINICDGRRLGCVTDVEIDVCCGKLLAIIVPGEVKCFSFRNNNEMIIPWDRIEKIGDDIILVNIGDMGCGDSCRKPDRKRR